MRTSATNQIDPGAAALDVNSNTEALRTKLQMALLKKSLESQQEQARELQNMVEGKGHVIDLRV